jgi:RNA polymerase sigma-70 factor (ECF subfamily)
MFEQEAKKKKAPPIPVEELLPRIRRGDMVALEKLLEQQQPALGAFVTRYMDRACRDTADEISQTVWIKLVKRLSDPAFELGSFRGFLLKLARDACADYLRAERTREGRVGYGADVNLLPDRVDFDPAMLDDPERLAAVHGALEQLSAAHREAFLLHIREGLSFNEIAAKQNVPYHTARKRVLDAQAKLRKLCNPDED